MLSDPQDPADHMGEGHGQLLSLGVDCPVHGSSGHLHLPQTRACAKAIFFNAGVGKSPSGNLKVSLFPAVEPAGLLLLTVSVPGRLYLN